MTIKQQAKEWIEQHNKQLNMVGSCGTIEMLLAEVDRLEKEIAYCGHAQVAAKDKRIVELEKENKWIRSAIGDNATSFENGRTEAAKEAISIILTTNVNGLPQGLIGVMYLKHAAKAIKTHFNI